ncbi:MAG: metalloregulator ArsR/SmtB family transcription factor [Pseudomonadota bacterium]
MDKQLQDVAHLLKAAAEPTRLRLLAICAAGERSVSELTRALDQSQPRVSRHLRILVEANLLERFRDGHWVYYRSPTNPAAAAEFRRVLSFLPEDSAVLKADLERATTVQADDGASDPEERVFNRAILDFSFGRSIGRLLDMGSGSARILTILGASASEAVGIDNQSVQRLSARQRLANAGLGNCSIRDGDIHALPFEDAHFDTVVVDDVLSGAEAPAQVLHEARRVLAKSGRVLIVHKISAAADDSLPAKELGELAAAADLRISPPRSVPARNPAWLFFSGEARQTN